MGDNGWQQDGQLKGAFRTAVAWFVGALLITVFVVAVVVWLAV